MFAVRVQSMHRSTNPPIHRSTKEMTMLGTLTVGEQIMMAIVVVAVLGLAVFGVRRSKRSGQSGEAE
ncbi:hypothetical protein DDV98_05290 [Streptomyces sp. IB2014 011-12]|nr:hypothetical protein DDV98_05290 [Streptomyces sp. IB2014 011-12]